MVQIIIIVLIVAADLLTKYLLTPLMLEQAGNSLQLIPNVLHLTYVENTGASFGILQNSVVFFIIVTGIVLAAGITFMVRTRKTQSFFLKISLSLVIGGAFGNFYDRIVFGFVRDFIDFKLLSFWNWVFNIADAALVIGAILLGIYVLFIYKEKDGKPVLAIRKKRDEDEAMEIDVEEDSEQDEEHKDEESKTKIEDTEGKKTPKKRRRKNKSESDKNEPDDEGGEPDGKHKDAEKNDAKKVNRKSK
jgi:signal peptidase II